VHAFLSSRKDQISATEQAAFYVKMAFVLIDQGFTEKAMAYYKDALTFFDTGKFRIFSSITHSNIAGLYMKLEGPGSRTALKHYQQAARQASSIKDHVTVAASKIRMAEILTGQGQDQEAERLVLGAVQDTRVIDSFWSAKALIAAGHIAMRLGRLDAAEERLKKAQTFFNPTDRHEHQQIHQYLSDLYERQGRLREAV
jgi:tetratricopeptide (TPR) repeat protein